MSACNSILGQHPTSPHHSIYTGTYELHGSSGRAAYMALVPIGVKVNAPPDSCSWRTDKCRRDMEADGQAQMWDCSPLFQCQGWIPNTHASKKVASHASLPINKWYGRALHVLYIYIWPEMSSLGCTRDASAWKFLPGTSKQSK